MPHAARIVHLDFSLVWRGGQQQLLLLARGLRALEQQQTLVARPGVVMQRMQAEGFEVVPPGLAAWQRTRQAAVAHAHDGHAHTWMLGTGLLRRRPQRGLRVLSRRVAYPIAGRGSRWKYRRLDLVIAVSEYVRRQVAATGLETDRIRVIPDGIEADTLPAASCARERVRRSLRIDPAAPCLACLGALTPEKGVGNLLAAFARLPAACQLLLSGEGPLQASLRRQAEALAMGARVHFLAAADFSPSECVAAADLFVMPSREEGLGSAALLAMGLGRPIVATAVGGIPELVHHQISGWLVPAGDGYSHIQALANACARVLGDPERAAQMVAAGLRQVSDHHGSSRIAASTLAAYHTTPRRRS
ncbi:MAG: glycosyltransferase family 4 protein [Terriglobales bacterium]